MLANLEREREKREEKGVIAGRRIGVMGDAAETNKTLHNWMGEPRPRSSDQRDEEETLQLSLGLPGGGASAGGRVAPAAWRMLPARDEEMRSAAAVVDTSLLSLGYSAPAFSPRSPGMNASATISGLLQFSVVSVTFKSNFSPSIACIALLGVLPGMNASAHLKKSF